MSHPAPSLPEQREHEILIPLSSYPDSQRKDSATAPPLAGAWPAGEKGIPPQKGFDRRRRGR
eukprot:6051384-Pyramimonas_sp.AAC.1